MRKRLRILMVTVALVLSGCSEIGVRQEVMVSEDIQVLYDYLQVIPEEVIMSEYDKVAGYTRCHVESEKDKEKNGYYCLYTYTKNREKFVHIAKEVSAEEKKEKEIEWNSDYRLCRSLYEGPLDAMRKETNEYQVPKVDCSTIKSYKERKLRADTTGGFRGYIDKDGKYKVPYIENWSEDSKWKLKEFSDGKWKEKKIITNKEIPSLDYYLYYGGRDGNFWYNGAWNGDEEILIVSNSKGNILGKLNLTDWKRTRKIEELQIEYTYLPDEKVIISYTKENGDEKSERVDMATGKTEKTYNMLLMGEAYDDTLVQYDSDSDYVSVYNWKTGQAMYRLDLSGLRKQYTGLEGRYVMCASKEEGYITDIFSTVYADNLLYGREEIPKMKVSLCEDELYISYSSGVYRYDKETKKLYQMLDPEKQDMFNDMYGDVDVGKNGEIYMLGFYGGGDDEGANDFIYLELKE